MKKIGQIVSMLLLTSCGFYTQITPQVQDEVEKQLPQIDARGGQLCICRASNFVGSANSFKITADEESIGRLTNSSYFCVNLTPDNYIISTHATFISDRNAKVVIKRNQRQYMELQAGNSINLGITTKENGLSCIYSVGDFKTAGKCNYNGYYEMCKNDK